MVLKIFNRKDPETTEIEPEISIKDETKIEVTSLRSSDTPYIDLSQDLTPEQVKERNTKWFKFRVFLWDSVDKHPLERKFLIKLDFFLLSSSMLGYFIKNLNQSNITTAYVNGMSEYYDMDKNQLNYLTTLWTVGYIIGQIPSNLILHRISARYYLGGLELIWSILTILMITCGKGNIKGMYAIRFFMGLTESGYFPGLEYVLGSWYAKEELSKRSTFFACAGVAASLVSGPLQQRILTNFAHSKLVPFKWMFVFDAIISFPVGIYTMSVDPNTPSTTNAWYFNKTDRLVALERRRRIGAQLNTRGKYTIKKLKSFFNTWHIWVFPFIFIAYNNSAGAISQPTFTTWMKLDLKLSSEQYNVYPSSLYGGGIGLALIIAYVHDFFGGKKNHILVIAYMVCLTIGCALLSAWTIPVRLHWFAYYLIGIPTVWGMPQIYPWINRLLYHDDMKRNFVIVVTNTSAYVTSAWINILVWNTEDQPVYHIGFTYTACLASFGIVMTSVAAYLAFRDEKRELNNVIENTSENIPNIRALATDS